MGGHLEPDGWTPGIYSRREETAPDHRIPLPSINLPSQGRGTPGLSPPYSGATWQVDGWTPGTWWMDTRNLTGGHPEPDGWTPGIYSRGEETAPDHSIPLSGINLSSYRRGTPGLDTASKIHPEPDGWTPGTWWMDTRNLMGGHLEPDGWTPRIYSRGEESTPDHSIPLPGINFPSHGWRTPGLHTATKMVRNPDLKRLIEIYNTRQWGKCFRYIFRLEAVVIDFG